MFNDVDLLPTELGTTLGTKLLSNNNNNNNNLYFERVTPITIKSILPSGPLKTKLIIINCNSHDKKPIYK